MPLYRILQNNPFVGQTTPVVEDVEMTIHLKHLTLQMRKTKTEITCLHHHLIIARTIVAGFFFVLG